jgi:MFS family permease
MSWTGFMQQVITRASLSERRTSTLAWQICCVTKGILAAIRSSRYGSLWVFTVLFTFVEAIFPVGWATVGDFFGRKSFATIRGTMSFFYLWGPALGPVITGAVYDRYQSYAPMMTTFIALSLAAGCLYALLAKPSLPAAKA